MKKIINTLSALIILFVSFSSIGIQSSNAATGDPFLSIEVPNKKVSPDQNVSGVMYLTTPSSGFNITSYDITLIYNPHLLRFTSLSRPSNLFDQLGTATPNAEKGSIRFSASRTNASLGRGAVSGKIPLGTVSFQAKKATGISNVQFINAHVYSALGTLPISVDVPVTEIEVSKLAGNSGPNATPTPTPTPECFDNGLPGRKTDFGCLPQDSAAFSSRLYGIGLGLIGGVALLFIIYAGYLLMTSSGNREQINKARSYMFYAIAGLLLAIFGFVFLQVIARDLLKIPGFG